MKNLPILLLFLLSVTCYPLQAQVHSISFEAGVSGSSTIPKISILKSFSRTAPVFSLNYHVETGKNIFLKSGIGLSMRGFGQQIPIEDSTGFFGYSTAVLDNTFDYLVVPAVIGYTHKIGRLNLFAGGGFAYSRLIGGTVDLVILDEFDDPVGTEELPAKGIIEENELGITAEAGLMYHFSESWFIKCRLESYQALTHLVNVEELKMLQLRNHLTAFSAGIGVSFGNKNEDNKP